MKKMKRNRISIVLALFLFTTMTISVYAEKARIAVLPFIVDESVRVTINNTQLIPRVIETEFTGLLMEFLVNSRKFHVLERDYLRKIMLENNLTESEYIKPGEAARIGKLLVADYIVIGHIDRLQFALQSKNIALTGENVKNVKGTFKIHFRITEVKSGKIVFAKTLKKQIDSKTIPFAERKDMTLADFKDKLFSATATNAGNLVLEGIYPVKIASANGTNVILNRGEGTGIVKGKRYAIYSLGETVTDPDTGEVLGSEEIKVGEIEVTSVEAKFSKAKVIIASGIIAKGSICRSIEATPVETPAPSTPAVTPGW
jgi:curli biogenesis system outer membrane secretion channel CsgG